MEGTARRTAGNIVAAILLTDAVFHLYWLTGATWPASDVRELSLALLGDVYPFTPRVLIPLALALVLAATAVLLCSRQIGPQWVQRSARLVTATICIAASGRAVLGLFWLTGVGIEGNTTLYWLNLVLYTPLCLILSVSSVLLTIPSESRRSSRRVAS